MLTALIETAVFAAAGYRRKIDLCLCASVNLLTNLALNLVLSLCGSGTGTVVLLEILVVAAEYICYSRAYGKGNNLFPLVLFSNLLSYLIGRLIYG